MANNDKITKMYNALVKSGYNMASEDVFRQRMSDPAKRRAAYDALKESGYNMRPYDEFEQNIGYGKPAPAPQQPTQTPATPTTDTPAPTTEQTQVQSEPEQPAWQPTEQEKIRMSYQIHTMLNDFNQKSKARMEQIQRISEPFTAEGRKKRRAMEFQAQLAGTPTKVMGLTPPTPAPATEGAEGAAEGEAQQQPVRSGQSPVPYGVKYIDGKPVTQWLLPDGRLTTSLIEADQAEYSARTYRLQHQFENRMKQNGLDPAKPEDVEMQAQFDAQAPAYGVVADLWREAEEKHKADKERNASKAWDSYNAMGGGREMRIVTTSMNRHADNISHMTRFDLQKMMDNAWERVGLNVASNCYNRLRQQYPGASDEELQATASQMARQLTDNAVYQYAVQQNTPKSTLEYFGRTVADMNVINSISKGLARSQAGTSGDLPAYESAMSEYGKNHRVAQVAGTVVGMAVDPVTWVSGGVGSAVGKGAISLGGRYVASRAATSMSTQVGSRLFSSSQAGRIITGAAAGGGNFATYEMLKEGESQFLHGGHVNAETGEVEGYSAGAILKTGGHGLVLGSVTGTLSPMIGNVADKYVKATSSTAGKAGVRLGEVAVSTVAEGTVFSIPEWISGEGDAYDVWTDNMAMMLGFKASHGIKSAPRVIASLRPIQPTNGRPLTQSERNHNRMSFEERLRKNLDASPSDLSFTADEREELRRAGYGELADLFSRDRVDTQNPNIDPAEGAIELRAERVEAETIHNNPEFDGYSAMEALMQDGRVSQAARAKAYYILTGRMLPMGSVTGYTTHKTEDGRVTVNATTADGEIVTSRTFKNEQEAKQETDNIMRQAELNTIDVGERYKEAVADDMVLDAAISEVSPGADPATIKKIYRSVKAGNKDVTESQVQLVEFLDEAIARNSDIADKYRPEAIRAELMKETGIDVDAVLRKMPSKRTEAEQAAVKSYLERLYPEEARQQNVEPTPEQAEAQNQYEQGRLLYGRFDEGDPTAQADVDAIALRMQEAYQAVEDAFGAEAEYYMFHVNENPWALVNDPELTAEQQDAVLYYINAKAALDGVLDASNETADRKRAEVKQSVGKRTHKDNGMVIPAIMKVDDRQVYVVKGDVAMFPDGSAVDVRNSSESVVVMDAQTGEYEFTSPDQIFKVSEAVNPQDELDTALSVIEQEQMSVFGQNAAAPEEPAEGSAPIDQSAEVSPEPAPEATSTEEYDRGYEQGLEAAAKADDAWIDNLIKIYSQNTPESMSETMKGQLDAYLYEQQRRAQAVPENAESIPNPAENAETGAQTTPESIPTSETALSRIPTNEQGEPIFEAVDKDTAWDGLVEAVGGEADAADIAMAQVQQATADLEALKKKPPTQKAPKLKGSPMAMAQAKREATKQYQRDLAQYNQQIADTQARLNAWNGIVGVYTSRNAELRRQQEEERRQRDAIAHDEAVARFNEEQRIKAEKQAEQERIGVHAVNPKIKDKWDSAPKVEGNEDALTLPDGSTISGRYILTEAGAASPSHDVNNAYAPTEGFPIDENGQSVNDRDYQRDKDAQQKVEGMAGNYDNRALQDPVIVSKDGVVLSGNNRTMSGDLAARQGTDKAYNDYLSQFGHKKYGFTPEQVAGMKNPRVVFVPDETLPYDATTFARFNAQEKKSQGKPEAAVKLGKIVPDNVFMSIANDISRYDRLSDYYADEKAIAHALGALMQAGVINDMQMPELRTGTALSATGKELIENTLIGKVFQTSPDAVRQIISMPTLRQSIVMGLNEIANNRTLARQGYDLSEELSKAVDLVSRARAAMPDVYTDGMPVSPFGRMQGLFDDEYGDSRVTDATTLLLADLLNSGKPSDIRKVLASYNNEASQSASGQADIFTGEVPSKENILKDVNEHFRNATPREQQALVDAAIAERKRRAEAEAEQRGRDQEREQVENAVERSADGPVALVEPTEAQKAAGNYKKEHRRIDGYNISIENPKGSVRSGKDADGKEWQTEMHNDYGYIRGTEGVDGDHIDVFLSDTPEEGDVFVIDQRNADGSFDEHKVMYGFPSEEAAREAYLSNYEPGWTGLGAITQVSKDEFKKWVHSSKRKTKPFADYKSVKAVGGSNTPAPAEEVTTTPYTITPSSYTNKAGKTTPMHSVKFSTPPTYEQRKALVAFAREKADGKKARGWCSDKDTYSEWLFRSEEDARKAGEMIADQSGETVADAQPMTAEELREAVAPTTPSAKPAKTPRPKKAPINRVSLDDVMTDLSTKGETKLSDHAEPVKKEPEVQHEISDDEMQSLANELRDLLGIGEDEGNAGFKFRDPGELTPQERQRIQSAGIRLAMGLVERGTTSFPDYATKMVGLLGDKIRPWLKSFYEGARWTPGYENIAFTPSEEVARFDVQNFDKAQPNPIAQAAMIVEERKASTASAQAQKELTEIRNNKRKKQDEQTSADTAALTSKAEAVARKAESLAETSEDTAELNRAGEEIDQTIEEINEQLALLGYYEAVEDDAKFHESYGYMLTAEKKAVADATKLAKQLVNDLGIDIKVTSATTPLGRKSVKKGTAVRANIAPAGGDVIVNLPLNEGRILAIYIGLEPVAEKGSRRQGDNLAVERILYRVENPNGKGMERYGHNMYAPVESTYADFLRRVKEITRDYLPKEKSVDELWQEWSDMAERGESPYTITPEVEAQLAEERKVDVTHNGYKVGDEVMWDRYGNGNWEKVKIEDFDTDGGPIFEAVKGVMSEKGDWSRVKPADGIFGEAKRVARAAQEKKRSSRKKDVTLKPEQPVGDLFGGLFDNTQNSSNHEETEMGTRPGEAGRQRQQLKQDTQVGGDEPRRETERPAGEAGSGSTGMDSDADRAGGRGLHDVATQPALDHLPEKERKNVHNNHVERGTEVAPKSESARIKANIAAIETMKKLEASGEAPTAADMKKLRAFSGWGGLGKAFSDWDTSRQLRQLLGDKLYDEGAEMSRNSAYFTPAYIVDAMWDIARAMGFKGGRVLEGSAGIGNVLGLMPQDLSERSYIRAVEKDPTTGKMLSLLYPDAVVDIDGFEKVKIETGTYDLVITNVPFVPGLKVADTSGDSDISKEFKTSIHDFCIAKNVRKLRDGGVGVFITTAGSMDGTGRLHKWLSNRENADIVGMFRMHNETFGGTNATSDIIVVRKRVNGVKSPNAIDCSLTTGVRTAEYDTGEKKKVKNVGEVPIIKTLSMSYNRYYVEHPEYMAGEMHFGFEKGDTSFRPESKGLYPIKEKDQSQLLSQWVEDMKQKLADTSEEPTPTVMNHRDEYVPTYDKVGNEVKTGTVVVDSQGRICVNYDGTARPLMSKLDNKNPKSADERIAQFNKNKVKGCSRVQVVQDYNAIKKALNDLLEYQKTSDSDEGLQPKLKALNRAFDSFVATYGHLHGNNGLAWLKNDVDYPSVIALETYREEGLEHKKVFGKADIFSRRVVVRPEQPKATNVRDGVTLSIRQTGSLDTRYIADQLGMSEADVRREVIEAGLGYENPLTHSMEAAHEYLSGNVREKMQQAEVNNEDGRYTPNITALRKVVPHNIPSHFIEFSIGSSWLRPELFEQYVKERTGASVKLTYAGGMWAMDKPKWTGEQDKSFGIRSEICDKIITGTELIEAAMTNRTIRVSKQQKDGPTISDPKATSACAAKVDEIRDDFKSWLRSRMESAPELAKEIEETYNNIFNNSAPMTIPDEYIPEYFDGAARVIGGKPIKMRKHQSKAIVRGTMQSLMLAHEVGTGKTFTLITTAMEMRRLGTAKKPMIVVQNATLGQFVASAKALYPDARILSLEDKDRNAEGRKDFYAKIRYNDWDMVVIPQSVLERIPDHPDRERRFIEESIQEKMDVIGKTQLN